MAIDGEILGPLTQKHVAPGYIVHTDGWRAYLGYKDHVVNHSEEFVAPHGTHTQCIEASRRPMRRHFRGRCVSSEDFADHIVVYL